jgi:methionyl-tRNA synthetase
MSKKFYITTAIDYVNSLPHIGTAYEKIGADVIARWRRFMGDDVRFQMGNDEHSINVWKEAKKRGLSPKDYCDEMRKGFESVWKKLDISYDGFIQTSDPDHEKSVKELFSRIEKKGDIYKSRYEGFYCESCEAFLTDKDLVDGACPNHKTKPQWVSEENYFFALSKYRDALVKHIKKNPEFILPEVRRNEILSLLNEGLQDISVSRSSFDWGISLPNDSKHIVYVWFDALINYISAVGFGSNEADFKRWWPAQMHVVGKDITRFHCVIWPAMLMSAGLPLPKTVFGHGFVYLRGEKMSKTLGNIVSPLDVANKFGADTLRYYLMREGSFGRDADFTWEHFIARYNGDLANGIGNLVSRTVGMATKYLGGKIPPPKKSALTETADGLAEKVAYHLDHESGDINFHHALSAIWEAAADADRLINDTKPWELAKAQKMSEIAQVLGEVAVVIRAIAVLLNPFMPSTAEKIWATMGFSAFCSVGNVKFDEAKRISKNFKSETVVVETSGLFPRIEKKEAQENKKPAKEPAAKESKKMDETKPADDGLIDIQAFGKIELRVAEVVEASPVEGADKLLKLIVDLGMEKRQIVAGIAKHYKPEELIGKKIVVVANLKPVKLRGVESNGMLLAASDENTLSILSPARDVSVGSKVK